MAGVGREFSSAEECGSASTSRYVTGRGDLNPSLTVRNGGRVGLILGFGNAALAA
jgi:hypothetical protein